MSQGIQFIDIIFLGLVAGFLVLRLRSVLGRRTGSEKRQDPYGLNRQAEERQKERGNVVDLPGRHVEPDGEAAPDAPQTPLQAGLVSIRTADPSFEADRFLGGARMAFEMIVDAYAKGDEAALRPLLAADVCANFVAAIRARREQNHTLETEIAAFKKISLESVEMKGSVAFVAVRFVTEQMILTKDSEGRIVEGDPSAYETVTDIWTFSRDTSTRDPNWLLVATATPAE